MHCSIGTRARQRLAAPAVSAVPPARASRNRASRGIESSVKEEDERERGGIGGRLVGGRPICRVGTRPRGVHAPKEARALPWMVTSRRLLGAAAERAGAARDGEPCPRCDRRGRLARGARGAPSREARPLGSLRASLRFIKSARLSRPLVGLLLVSFPLRRSFHSLSSSARHACRVYRPLIAPSRRRSLRPRVRPPPPRRPPRGQGPPRHLVPAPQPPRVQPLQERLRADRRHLLRCRRHPRSVQFDLQRI